MAKKRASGGPNKSQAIRDYYEAHPDAMPKAVVDALKSQGIDVSAQFVSTVRSKQLKDSGAGTRRRKPGRPKGATKKKVSVQRSRAAAPTSGDTKVSIEQLVQAKEMADAMGGIEKARRTLDALSQIVG